MSARFMEELWGALPAQAQRDIATQHRRAAGKKKTLTDLDVTALSVNYYEAEIERLEGERAALIAENTRLRQLLAGTAAPPTPEPSGPPRKRAAQRRIGVFALLRDPHGRVLLVQQGAGAEARWSLPGGKLKASETIAAGLAREVREETGWRIRPRGLAAVVARESRDALSLVFAAPAPRRTPAPHARDEIAAARFFSPGALPAPLTPLAAAVLAAPLAPAPSAWLEITAP